MAPPATPWGFRQNELALLEWGEAQTLHAALLHGHGTPAMYVLARNVQAVLYANVCDEWKDTIYRQPSGVEPDIDCDIECARSENGQIPGMCCLAEVFISGSQGMQTNVRLAEWLLRRDVTAYDCNLARYKLADLYELGRGDDVAKNPTLSVVLYEQLWLDTGLLEAAKSLAVLLDSERDDVKPDWRRAAKLYEYVVENSDDTGMLDRLVDIYWFGRDGLLGDPLRSVEFYERYERSSLKPAYSRSMNSLAIMFEEGSDGFDKDPIQALAYYGKAIDLNPDNAEAITNLGILVENGAPGLPQNERRAERCYCKAASLGNFWGKVCLTNLVGRGYDGTPPDKFKAMKLCEELLEDFGDSVGTKFNVAKALKRSDDDLGASRLRAVNYVEEILDVAPDDESIDEDLQKRALNLLGDLLVEGCAGVIADRPRAISLFERAILEYESLEAMHSLAWLISDRDFENDLPRAIELLVKAIEGGENDATILLAVLLTESRDGPPIDLERGKQLYEDQIAEWDDMSAMVNLADVLGRYDHGYTDIPRAIELCERAISQALKNDKDGLAQLGIEPFSMGPVRIPHVAGQFREMNIQGRWHLIGMCNLADILVRKTVEKDVDRALSLFERALNDARASEKFQEEPVSGHWTNDDRLPIDDYYFMALREISVLVGEDEELCKKAVRVYELAIRRTGSTRLMCLLAELLLQGKSGFPRDPKKAICYYKRAIFKGNTSAMLALGEILCADNPTDERYAFELFARIVGTDEVGVIMRSAVINLALMYEKHHREKKRGKRK